jgi:hypothetical protein
MMTPELRDRVAKESAAKRLVETYRLAQRKTELSFDEIVLEDQTPGQITVRATLTRRSLPLIDGAGPTDSDRVQVELLAHFVPPTVECPDGLQVQEWRMVPFALRENGVILKEREREGSRAEP